ncbi:MAG: VacJ family lipoprotein [Victivallaceae bacterium]
MSIHKILFCLGVAVLFSGCTSAHSPGTDPQPVSPVENKGTKAAATKPAAQQSSEKTQTAAANNAKTTVHAEADNKPAAASTGKTEISAANPPLDLSEKLTGQDSVEGFNRTMYSVNHFFIRWVFRPIGSVYGSIIPRPGIDAINRFTDNLGFPVRMFSCFCEAKFGGGGIEFLRFLSNTTLGVAGFFEVADPWFGLRRQDDDFGKAFYCWGIGSGCYLFLPGAGPANVRDGVGKIFDYAFDPKSYIYFGQTFTYLNLGTRQYADYERMSLANCDPYQLFKDLGGIKRELTLTDWSPVSRQGPRAETAPMQTETKDAVPAASPTQQTQVKPEASPLPAEFGDDIIRLNNYDSQGAAIDTLRMVMFNMQKDEVSLWVDLSWWNSDFPNQGSVRSVKMYADKPAMDYKVWYQDKKDAPLAIVIPGLGGHCTSTTAGAMAEVLFNRGYSVVAMSSGLNWEFMESASSVLVPGYTPVDAADVRDAACKILEDLTVNKGLKPERKVMVGLSMGALHTLFIAQMEMSGDKLGMDRYVAINPPVNLKYGLNELDKYYDTMHQWGNDQQQFEQMMNAAGKFMMLIKRKYPWEDYTDSVSPGNTTVKDKNAPPAENLYRISLNENEARVLVGYSFKRTLDEIIVSIHHRQNLGVLTTPYSWGNRTALYHELVDYSFNRYLNTFAVKYYSEKWQRQVTPDELNRQSSLTAIGPQLADNSKVRVIHSLNDFLESDADRTWLRNTFADRIVFFEYGGHLGNLYLKKLHDVMLSMLDNKLPPGVYLSPAELPGFIPEIKQDEPVNTTLFNIFGDTNSAANL